MTLKRWILAALGLGAGGALILGMTGVLAPPAPDTSQRGAPPPESIQPNTITMSPFVLTRGSLSVKAEKGTSTLGGETHLEKPVVEMTVTEEPSEAGPGGETRVHVEADRGQQWGPEQSLIRLSGNVVARATGARNGVVRLDDITWDTKRKNGFTQGRVVFEVRTQEGTQRGSGRGAEWDLVTRRGRVSSQVKMVLEGFSPMGGATPFAAPAPAPAVPPAPAVSLEVECAGELNVDSASGMATLERAVKARQGEAGMSCDRMTLEFAEGERRLQNVSAAGDVKFMDRGAGLDGECARLAQRTADGVVELIGDPLCRVRVKGSEIEAPRLVLKGGRLEAWDPGRMTLLGPAEGGAGAAPRKVEVSWKGRMALARDEGQAEFRGGVVFRDGAAEVSCETLRADFDAKEGKARRIEARGGVAFKAAEGEGTGDRLVVDPEGEAFELHGRPARLGRGGQKFEGDEVRVDRKTGVVASDKPGVMTADAAAMGMEGGGGVAARWSNSVRYWTQEQRVLLKGDVKLEMGGQTMEGQEIEIRRGDNVVIGRGPGAFASKGEEGLGAAQGRWAQSMTYLTDQQTGTLRGGVALEAGGQRLQGEEVQFSRKENTVIVRGPGSLSAPEGAAGAGGLKGPARAQWQEGLTYAVGEQRAVLRGAVKMETGDQELLSEEVELKQKEKLIVARGPGSLTMLLEPVATQGAPATPATPATPVEKVHASWREGMAYSMELEKALLRGEVKLTQGEQSLEAEEIEIRRREETVTARGPGRMKGVVAGAGAPGAPAEGGPPAPAELSWQTGMSVLGKKRVAVFTGATRLRQAKLSLDAETLTALFDKDRKLEQGVAEGNVTARDEERKALARGEKLEWRAGEGTARLWGGEGKPAYVEMNGFGQTSPQFVFRNGFQTVEAQRPRSVSTDD